MRRVNKDERAKIAFILNSRAVAGDAEPRLLLTDFLRHVIGATGTHVGCEHGVCGCCTVLIDGAAVRGCLTLAVQAEGRSVNIRPATSSSQEEGRAKCGNRLIRRDTIAAPGEIVASEYPPAEPGALWGEPLEAAVRGRSRDPVAVDRSCTSPASS